MTKTQLEKRTLYIIATPIGNLADISERAIHILNSVDFLFAEDTRHSNKLLQHYGISRSCSSSLHEFNEEAKIARIVQLLQDNKTIGIITDAGTPSISDPGFKLIRAVHYSNRQRNLSSGSDGIKICAIPGACALIAALSCSGLATDSFFFAGFLPAKTAGRQTKLKALAQQTATLIFYEAPHRLLDTLNDIYQLLGDRDTCIAKELTKIHESVITGLLSEQLLRLSHAPEQIKGEYVILLAGYQPPNTADQHILFTAEQEAMLKILVKHCGIAKAAEIASELTGIGKNRYYKYLLQNEL